MRSGARSSYLIRHAAFALPHRPRGLQIEIISQFCHFPQLVQLPPAPHRFCPRRRLWATKERSRDPLNHPIQLLSTRHYHLPRILQERYTWTKTWISTLARPPRAIPLTTLPSSRTTVGRCCKPAIPKIAITFVAAVYHPHIMQTRLTLFFHPGISYSSRIVREAKGATSPPLPRTSSPSAPISSNPANCNPRRTSALD